MSYLKSLTSKDIIVTPFKVHKEFSVGELSTYNPEGVFKFIGGKVNYPEVEGKIGTGSTSLAYNSIKQLYYSNYLENGTNGLVSNVGTASVNPDDSITGPRYTPNYINNIQSIDDFRYFPTSSDKYIVGISIPSKFFGENIKPGSVSVNLFTDNGQGIPSKNLEKIFDPFFTTNREHGGTGLGLNIIYNIVTNNLNGSLSCESKEEQGTIFTIVIPTNKKGLKC